MNEPPTLILWDGDEECTLVDRAQVSDTEQAFAGPGHRGFHQPRKHGVEGPKHAAPQTSRARRSLLPNRRREIVELCVALALLVGLGSVMHQQRRLAENVREALADIPAIGRDTTTVRPEALPPMRTTNNRGDVERRAAEKNELAGDEREALEKQAAALIASNDFSAALARYEALGVLFPHDETLPDVISVLRAKLRCNLSARFGSGACR
ncbi:MAG: hypothetical protein HKN10_16360 [Myxococcales bacterium]|nr:hypothetical protein [Myxococcales bacterium]